MSWLKLFGGLALVLAMALAACAPFSTPDPARGKVPQLATNWTQVNRVANALGRGRVIARIACTQCHRYYEPREYASWEWPRIVLRMAPRASLTHRQALEVIVYLRIASWAVREMP
jgi:hypothetical protein